MSEFEKWFAQWVSVPFDDSYKNIERDSVRDAWNAALEAAAKAIEDRFPWTIDDPGGTAAEIARALKHTPEQSNG